MIRARLLVGVALCVLAAADSMSAQASGNCDDLAKLAMLNSSITLASQVGRGAFTPPAGNAGDHQVIHHQRRAGGPIVLAGVRHLDVPDQLSGEAMQREQVRVIADRLKPFDGEMPVRLSAAPGLTLPENIIMPRGQTSVDLELKIAPDRMPGRVSINLYGSAVVNSFEEDYHGGRFDVEVFKTPPPKTVVPKK